MTDVFLVIEDKNKKEVIRLNLIRHITFLNSGKVYVHLIGDERVEFDFSEEAVGREYRDICARLRKIVSIG